jgi:hypothetical protein
LNLEKLEHGLAMPRNEYAIAQTKAMLEQARSRLVVRKRGLSKANVGLVSSERA